MNNNPRLFPSLPFCLSLSYLVSSSLACCCSFPSAASSHAMAEIIWTSRRDKEIRGRDRRLSQVTDVWAKRNGGGFGEDGAISSTVISNGDWVVVDLVKTNFI
ncbi:hypothetical protein L1887_27871 [Cichorium endivia]|nr:hypothetical protein L1887_27871 [Cichorium endivia]